VVAKEPLDKLLHRITKGPKLSFKGKHGAQREHARCGGLFAELAEPTLKAPPFDEATQSADQRNIRGRLRGHDEPALDFLQRTAGHLGEEIEIEAGRVEAAKGRD